MKKIHMLGVKNNRVYLFLFGVILIFVSAYIQKLVSIFDPRLSDYHTRNYPLYDPKLDFMIITSMDKEEITIKFSKEMYVKQTQEINLFYSPGSPDLSEKYGALLESPVFKIRPEGFIYKGLKDGKITIQWTWLIKADDPGTQHLLLYFKNIPISEFSYYRWPEYSQLYRNMGRKIGNSLRNPQPIEVNVLTTLGLNPKTETIIKYLIMLLGFVFMYPLIIELIKRLLIKQEKKMELD